MIKAGERLGDDLRLTIYLEEEPVLEMQSQLVRRITNFSPVEEIRFTSREDAYSRLAAQLGDNVDVLDDLDPSFLPPSIEVYPKKNLSNLAQIKRFSEYLSTLPGAVKVQYGQEWVERFNYFTKLFANHCYLKRCSSHFDDIIYGCLYYTFGSGCPTGGA